MGTFSVINVKDYGAVGNGTTDDTSAIQSAINASTTNGVVYFPDGTYKTTAPLRLPQSGQIALVGNHVSTVTIKKTTNTNGTTPNRQARNNSVIDSFVVDSILSVDHPDNGWADNVRIEHITFEGASISRNNFGLYVPRSSHVIIRNVLVKKCNYGFFTYDSWLSVIEAFGVEDCISVLKYTDDGSGQGTGSSLTATRVHGNTVQIGYDIFGLHYSTFNSCACDFATAKAYNFQLAHGITLNSCGAEEIDGEVIMCEASELVINSFQTWAIDGIQGGTHAYLYIDSSKAIFNSCKFVDFTNAYNSYNLIVQNGSAISFNCCRLPSGGNTWISYSNGSVVVAIDQSGVTAKTYVDTERLGSISAGHRIFWGTAAPTSGAWSRGDQIINSQPNAGGYIGWVCIATGTPGIWKGFGIIGT